VVEHLPHYAATLDEVDETMEAERRHTALVQAEVRHAAEMQGVEPKILTRVGHAAKTLVDYAREGAFDLIVLGHAGHSGIWGTLLGATGDRVVDHAPCSVLVVR
jgi:nucleotide-binding universal stress UspA family protein